MKLVFNIERQNTFIFFASLINECIRRGCEIELWHHYFQDFKQPLVENSPFFKNGYDKIKIKKLLTKDDPTNFIRNSNGVDYFVNLNPATFTIDDELLKKINGKWCMIMHGHDSFATVWDWQEFKFKGDLLQNYDRIFFPSTESFYKSRISWLKKYANPYGKDNYKFFTSKRTRIYPIGFPVYDKKLRTIDEDVVCTKYKIPKGKGVLIYLPFPYYPGRSTYGEKQSFSWQVAFAGIHINFLRNIKSSRGNPRIIRLLFSIVKKLILFLNLLSDKEARTWFFNGWHEPAVIKVIKKFCIKNDLLLIVKPKINFPFSEEVYKCSDIIVEDDESQQYPTKLQELITLASIVLGYHTSAVSESVAGKSHHINLECPASMWANNKARIQNHSTDQGTRNNFQGIVTNMKISKFISQFSKMNIEDFKIDSNSRKLYLEEFLGPDSPTAAENFFNILEKNNS
jgi:hypothetical protein